MKRSKKFQWLTLFLLTSLLSSFKMVSEEKKIRLVVIDAGHGGKDPGCHGVSAKEKEVALAVALLAGQYITDNIPDVRVIYTRQTDTFVELYQRANIANKAKADVFISIHCNSGGKGSFGTETFALGTHRLSENFEVAKRENSVIFKEKDYKKNYDGFDPSEPETYIFLAAQQSAFQEESLLLAAKIQDQYKKHANRSSRGVKQQGLAVLAGSNMPGILTEIGFLSNPTEEKFLNSKAGKEYIAGSIYRAFKEFKAAIDSKK